MSLCSLRPHCKISASEVTLILSNNYILEKSRGCSCPELIVDHSYDFRRLVEGTKLAFD